MYLEGMSWSFTQGEPTSKSLCLMKLHNLYTLKPTKKKKLQICLLSSFSPPPSPALILPSSFPSRLPLSTPLFNLLSITTIFPFVFLLHWECVTNQHIFPWTPFFLLHSVWIPSLALRNVTSVLPQQQITRHFSFPEIYCKARWIVPCSELIPPPFLLRRKLYFLSFMFSPFLSPFNSCFLFFPLRTLVLNVNLKLLLFQTDFFPHEVMQLLRLAVFQLFLFLFCTSTDRCLLSNFQCQQEADCSQHIVLAPWYVLTKYFISFGGSISETMCYSLHACLRILTGLFKQWLV